MGKKLTESQQRHLAAVKAAGGVATFDTHSREPLRALHAAGLIRLTYDFIPHRRTGEPVEHLTATLATGRVDSLPTA